MTESLPTHGKSAHRKASWLMERNTKEEEFFHPSQQHHQGSLAGIAAQQVLVRHPLGSIAFADQTIESEWIRCVAQHESPSPTLQPHAQTS